MHDPKDVEALKLLRREFMKHFIDTAMADLRVSHGVAYVRGTLSNMPGATTPCKEATERVVHHLRTMPHLRDIVVDATFRD